MACRATADTCKGMPMNDAEKFLDAHPPDLPLDEVVAIAQDKFGITGTFRPLWGERDQNFMIERGNVGDVVLKITNARETTETVDLHVSAMRHLAQSDPTLPVARLVPGHNGETVVRLTSKAGSTHSAYVCTRLPGQTITEAKFVGGKEQTLYSTGALAGRTARALRGFFHPAAGNALFWDVRHMNDLLDGANGLDDVDFSQQVLDIANTLTSTLTPCLRNLRAQTIHHDVNQSNVLVDLADPRKPTGLIDFGDMLHGTIAQDVAVCATELCFGTGDLPADACAVVSGYDSAFELEEAEIDLIWDLMVGRCITGLLIGGARRMHDINSPHGVGYESLYRPVLEALLDIGRDRMRTTFRHACRFAEFCPPAAQAVTDLKDSVEPDTVETQLLDRRHAVLGRHALLSYDRPLHIVKGDGVWLFDATGGRYLDAYNNVPHVGHCHPHVVRAQSRQARMLNTNTRYVYESVIEYGERLAGLLPGDLGVTLFVNSGSEANDVAQRMALKLTGQSGSLIVDGAYHGITSEIYALSPSMDWGHGEAVIARHPSHTRPDIGVLPIPDMLRAPDSKATLAACEAESRETMQRLSDAGYPPGMFMFCSAFSSSGILDLPQDYISGIARRVQKSGGMVVCDEVQYGFGRSGDEFWGFANYGVTPDAVTLGKPMANGLAIGAVVTTPDNVERFTRNSEFFSTFGGNPVACAAANAVLDVIEHESLRENARTVGSYLRDRLRACAEAIPGGSDIVADVRGRGLFVGVEIVKDGETRTPDREACSRIKNHLRNNHVLVGSDGFHANVLKIRPPLVFAREHADILTEAFGAAIEAAIRYR